MSCLAYLKKKRRKHETKLCKWMIKQLLNSVLAKYRDLSVSRRSVDLLATDRSRYFARPRPIIDNYLQVFFHFIMFYLQQQTSEVQQSFAQSQVQQTFGQSQVQQNVSNAISRHAVSFCCSRKQATWLTREHQPKVLVWNFYYFLFSFLEEASYTSWTS